MEVEVTKELMRNASAVRIDKWGMVDCCKGRDVIWKQGVSWEFRIHDWRERIMMTATFIHNWMIELEVNEN